MGDRRKLLGTGAVLVGMGTALFSANGIAAADTEPDTTGPQADAAPSSAPARTDRGAVRSKGPAAGKSEATSPNANGSPAVRGTRAAAAQRAGTAPKAAKSERVAPSAATAPKPTATVAAVEPTVEPAVAAPAPQQTAVPVVTTVTEVPRGRIIRSVATTAAAAPAAAAVAPVQGFLDSVLGALGWGPGGAPTVATPALAAFTGQRADADPAAVVGTPVVAAAPPDPGQGDAGPALPGFSNGVTGVQIGHSRLEMPGAFLGDTVAADWYIPTQADGTVDAQGVIWLQHGFAATNIFYSELAMTLAMKTNSIVMAPTLSSIPFTFSGGCLICSTSEQAAAQIFLEEGRSRLVQSALDAGLDAAYTDQLLGKFAITGHSAGGGFSAAVASDYLDNGNESQDANLIGVIMFDGVSFGFLDGTFADEVQTLKAAGKPIYQIAAPAQAWNAFGATTDELVEALDGSFAGVVLANGSHVDAMIGVNPLFDFVLQLVTQRVPDGNTAAVFTLSTGWLNDMFADLSPDAQDTRYGFYAGANEAVIMGPTAALALATQPSSGDGVQGVIVPVLSNGVTGVRTGSSTLTIPSGQGYNAPADWYFPTQADGSVQANGVVWLQHGFFGFKDWYAVTAQSIAQETNSIVVVPSIFWFDDAYTGQAAAQMFLGTRSALNVSANAAGFFGPLPDKFLATGHSAGGRFATTLASTYVDLTEGDPQRDNLLGVVMFDGVSRPPAFTEQLENLKAAGIPDYQIAAPPQRWNAYGVGTEAMNAVYPDQFYGLQIDNGSHTDVIAGYNLFGILGDIASGIIVKPSPPGGKQAVRTLATGWINDIYGGYSPTSPFYGIYGNPNDGEYIPNQSVVMGQAGATTLPAPPPVDIEKYKGTWYEQGSVRQFFSVGLVNTTATYTPQPDGSVKVENSGNYFFDNGPKVNITGSAVPVNDFNTRLNVGFFFGQPGDAEPGNYWILDYAPDYSWAIVGDPIGYSGYILTREKIVSDAEYDALVARAKQLGVWGPILRTSQFPAAGSGAAVPGPAQIPGSVAV